MPVKFAELMCANCRETFLWETDVSDMALAEVMDRLEQGHGPTGWTVRLNAQSKREVICPKCAEASWMVKHGEVKLAPYSTILVCPACRVIGEAIKLRWCAGGTSRCGNAFAVQHLHHLCGRCGREWITATADST